MQRCFRCNLKNPLYVRYHDEERGQENFDKHYLFQMLILESFQAGLSRECVLNKREAFSQAYDAFDVEKIANYDLKKVENLMQNPGIIRHRLKILASITNAQIFLKIREEFGSFGAYLKTFTKGERLFETDKTTNPLSDTISKDLKKRGMKFVGSTIIYSYLQAIGVIYSHLEGCFLYQSQKLP